MGFSGGVRAVFCIASINSRKKRQSHTNSSSHDHFHHEGQRQYILAKVKISNMYCNVRFHCNQFIFILIFYASACQQTRTKDVAGKFANVPGTFLPCNLRGSLRVGLAGG